MSFYKPKTKTTQHITHHRRPGRRVYTSVLTKRPFFLDAYTLNVVGQDEFEDVKVPEKK